MKTFKQMMNEAASLASYKVGKSKVELSKKGSKVLAKIDGVELDTFKNESEAKAAVKDYMELMSK